MPIVIRLLKRLVPRSQKIRLIQAVDRLGAWPRRISAGPARGLTLLAPFFRGRAYCWGNYEPHVMAALSDVVKLGMTVCDVGSHLGYYTLAMAQLVGSEGAVYAFEPLPRSADTLSRTVQRNGLSQVEVVSLAVGGSAGKVMLDEWVNETMSAVSYGEPLPWITRQLPVAMCTLDEWLTQNTDMTALDCIKLDIEGQELAALSGAARTIERFRPTIICEIHRGLHVPYRPWEIVEWLHGAGYVVEPITAESRPVAYLPALLDRLETTDPCPGSMHVLHILATAAV